MSTARRHITELTRGAEGETSGAGEIVARARDSVVRVVSTYPRASLVGAAALGFLLAKLVRKIGEDWS
jgi:hypothetical protein